MNSTEYGERKKVLSALFTALEEGYKVEEVSKVEFKSAVHHIDSLKRILGNVIERVEKKEGKSVKANLIEKVKEDLPVAKLEVMQNIAENATDEQMAAIQKILNPEKEEEKE